MDEIQNIRPMREVALQGQKYVFFYCTLTASDMQLNSE